MKKFYVGLFVLFCFFSTNLKDAMAMDVDVMVTEYTYPQRPIFKREKIKIDENTTYEGLRSSVSEKFAPAPTKLYSKAADATPEITEENWSIHRAYLLQFFPDTPRIDGDFK